MWLHCQIKCYNYYNTHPHSYDCRHNNNLHLYTECCCHQLISFLRFLTSALFFTTFWHGYNSLNKIKKCQALDNLIILLILMKPEKIETYLCTWTVAAEKKQCPNTSGGNLFLMWQIWTRQLSIQVVSQKGMYGILMPHSFIHFPICIKTWHLICSLKLGRT